MTDKVRPVRIEQTEGQRYIWALKLCWKTDLFLITNVEFACFRYVFFAFLRSRVALVSLCCIYQKQSYSCHGIPYQRSSLKFVKYRRTPVSTGNTFQDLLRLHETADNTERYI
jgi:hypothetical protein